MDNLFELEYEEKRVWRSPTKKICIESNVECSSAGQPSKHAPAVLTPENRRPILTADFPSLFSRSGHKQHELFFEKPTGQSQSPEGMTALPPKVPATTGFSAATSTPQAQYVFWCREFPADEKSRKIEIPSSGGIHQTAFFSRLAIRQNSLMALHPGRRIHPEDGLISSNSEHSLYNSSNPKCNPQTPPKCNPQTPPKYNPQAQRTSRENGKAPSPALNRNSGCTKKSSFHQSNKQQDTSEEELLQQMIKKVKICVEDCQDTHASPATSQDAVSVDLNNNRLASPPNSELRIQVQHYTTLASSCKFLVLTEFSLTELLCKALSRFPTLRQVLVERSVVSLDRKCHFFCPRLGMLSSDFHLYSLQRDDKIQIHVVDT